MRLGNSDDTWLYAVLALAVGINFIGLFGTILEPDGALYATIAKTMVQRHDWIDLIVDGRDWLDKPHFPFWLAAASFSIFGFTTWAYKLPAFIFVLGAALYTYAFARKLYDRRVGLVAAIILLTAQHIILSSSDVRAEAYLTGLVIGAVFHFHRTATRASPLHLVLGSLLTAAAVMTKGIFVLVPIGGAIAGGLLLGGEWKAAFHWRWLLAILLVAVFISPELYCLWGQFDLHTEKVVFGQTGVSGLRFFFWDSQFGRFFNTGPIRGHGNPIAYVHTLLWAFLPWSIPLIAATYCAMSRLIRRSSPPAETFNLSGGLVTFVLLSASQFQLPHYLNIAFPFFAIMTSAYLVNLSNPLMVRLANVWLWLFVGAALVICAALQFFFVPGQWLGPAAILIAASLVLVGLQQHRWERWSLRLVASLAAAAAFANLYLSTAINPSMMKYQAGSEMAFVLNDRYPGEPVGQIDGSPSYALEFYLDAPATVADLSALRDGRLPAGTLVFAPAEVLAPMSDKFAVLERTASYPVSRPTLPFLNAATRGEVAGESWLVRIVPRQ